MSPKSEYTFPSCEAHNGSTLSNTEYASQVDTRHNAYYDNTDNSSTFPIQTMNSNFREYPPEQNNQNSQYNNDTQAHASRDFTQGDSRSASYSRSYTYPQYQYTAAPIYPPGYAMYPREVSTDDVQTTSAHDSTGNLAYLTRDNTYPSNENTTRPYTPVNGQTSNSPHSVYIQNDQGYLASSPPSPQAQRYIDAHTPEERIRLGLPRFEDQQQQIEYYEQQQINFDAHLDSSGR